MLVGATKMTWCLVTVTRETLSPKWANSRGLDVVIMVGNTLRIQLLEFGVFLGKGTRIATRNLDINRFTTFGSRALCINHLFYSTIEGNIVNVLRHPEIFNHSINWGWKSCAEWWRLERWPARSSVGSARESADGQVRDFWRFWTWSFFGWWNLKHFTIKSNCTLQFPWANKW